ncbi:MAG: polymer-forming cytoskeletal protein [Candidatus Manganitrophaceae bacterium]|nr:MAG: polymer-forming cytoskeletal protein [Candidatus Manganitrophaceae bacterium]
MLRRDEKEKGAQSDEIMAFLGKGTEFKGIITYSGTVRIDGKVEGEIVTQGKLIVGETAVINAEISAGTVICGGKISGNIRASQRVHLLSKAMMTGSVNTPNLIIEEGVSFNGKCEMGKDAVLAEVQPLQPVGHESNGS